VDVAAQGFRTPFASPNGEQQGGFGVDPPPPVLARRVGCPRLSGLGWRRPRGACRVTWCGGGTPRRSPWCLLAPEPRVASGGVATDVPLRLHGGLVQPWHVHNWFWFGACAPRSSGHVTARWESSACAGSRAPGRCVEATAPRGVAVSQRCGETRRDTRRVRALWQKGAVGEVPG
jgi:hypothetical protein